MPQKQPTSDKIFNIIPIVKDSSKKVSKKRKKNSFEY